MSKATTAKLGELHGAVADALTSSMRGAELEDGTVLQPSAAHIMAAITFLKANNITADPDSNTGVQALADQLRQRRVAAKQAMTRQVMDEVAEQLDRELGGGMLN